MNITTPPRRIAPGLAARLTGRKTAYLGTLFDLSRRGILCMVDQPRRPTAPTIRLAGPFTGARLAAHEQAFVQAVSTQAQDNRISLDKIAAVANDKAYCRALDGELAALGWLRPQPADQGPQWGVGRKTGLDALVPIRSLFSCLFGATGARPLTADGLRQAAAWNSFASYLWDITRGRAGIILLDTFERYLPYAAAFGFATQWNNYFNQLEEMAISAWFQALQTGQDRAGILPAILAGASSAESHGMEAEKA